MEGNGRRREGRRRNGRENEREVRLACDGFGFIYIEFGESEMSKEPFLVSYGLG